jgi:hypothetical protein
MFGDSNSFRDFGNKSPASAELRKFSCALKARKGFNIRLKKRWKVGEGVLNRRPPSSNSSERINTHLHLVDGG